MAGFTVHGLLPSSPSSSFLLRPQHFLPAFRPASSLSSRLSLSILFFWGKSCYGESCPESRKEAGKGEVTGRRESPLGWGRGWSPGAEEAALPHCWDRDQRQSGSDTPRGWTLPEQVLRPHARAITSGPTSRVVCGVGPSFPILSLHSRALIVLPAYLRRHFTRDVFVRPAACSRVGEGTSSSLKPLRALARGRCVPRLGGVRGGPGVPPPHPRPPGQSVLCFPSVQASWVGEGGGGRPQYVCFSGEKEAGV